MVKYVYVGEILSFKIKTKWIETYHSLLLISNLFTFTIVVTGGLLKALSLALSNMARSACSVPLFSMCLLVLCVKLCFCLSDFMSFEIELLQGHKKRKAQRQSR